MHYNSAGDQLKSIECIQDKALIISVVVPSELATCSRRRNRRWPPALRVHVAQCTLRRGLRNCVGKAVDFTNLLIRRWLR
jgi:hypothetical protein